MARFNSTIFCALILLLTSCSTAMHKSFDSLSIGDDKSFVVEKLGSPKYNVRKKDRDFWTYRYFRDDKEFKRTLIFEEAKLIEVGAEARILDPKELLIERDLEQMSQDKAHEL